MDSKWIFDWPELPPLPPPGEPVLIRTVTSALRPAARQELRAALREVLTVWSGFPSEQLPLAETSRGPEWQGLLAGHSLDISLSYCDGEGWIGLVRGCAIGVDAMRVQSITEAEAVAHHYLGPKVLESIRNSRQPAQTFALAWTQLEARLKCLKLELSEWNTRQPGIFKSLVSREMLYGRTAFAVATSS